MDMGLSRFWEMVMCWETWCAAVSGFTKSQAHRATEQQQRRSCVFLSGLYISRGNFEFIIHLLFVWNLGLEHGSWGVHASRNCTRGPDGLVFCNCKIRIKNFRGFFFSFLFQITALDFVEIVSLTWIFIS